MVRMSRTDSRKNMAEAGPHESRLYSDLAPLYDKTFAKFFYSRERTVIQDLELPSGAQILEVGVGTGTSFPAYPQDCHVIGIDQAPLMLARAREKIAENNWRHLEVREMDALDLAFSDNAFDYVMAFHVVSVVPDPIRMMAEMQRVCRPGGTIVIVNHFTSESRVWGTITKSLDPITRRLGWSTNLRLKPFLEATGFTGCKAHRYSRCSLYTVVVGTNDKE
jgi:phosphatidylethanolamine/phosphatidyl-N-methylethanolamine N-methyltransferase